MSHLVVNHLVRYVASGALALASLAAARRTREMGIRKVLGATASEVISLLSREFAWIGGVASLVAWPAAYYGCDRWLQGVAYRVQLGPAPFAVGGVLVVGTVLVVVCSQAFRASRLDPVAALRYE